MPQGPAHLHELFGSDSVAWNYLRRRGFHRDFNFIITPPWQLHVLTEMEKNAVDYLWLEWDYAYAPTRAPETPPGGSRLSQYRRTLQRLSSGPLRVTERYLHSLQMWWRNRGIELEDPMADYSYIEDKAIDDLFTFEDLPSAPTEIHAVRVEGRYRRGED